MKKEYIEPQMEVLNGELQQMICVSVDPTATAGEGEWGGPQSLDADFEEEEN